jgi:hypothetical protein
MKTKSLLLVALAAISLTACHPSQLMRTILRDQAKRGEMYHEILKNETYRAQLMDSIRNNRHTKLMLNSQNQIKKSSEDSKSGNR